MIKTFTDSLYTDLVTHIKSYHEKGIIDLVPVVYGTLDEALDAPGYQTVICIPPPTVEIERNASRPTSVLVTLRYVISVFVERAASVNAERGDNTNAAGMCWEITDAVLAKVVYTEINGFQMFVDRAYPVARAEQTQRQYDIECYIETQTGYDSCS